MSEAEPPWTFTRFLEQALNNPNPSNTVKFLAAAQYSFASLGIMFANKIVLTSYDFHSFAFLTLCQFATTVCILSFFKSRGWIDYPNNDIRMFIKVFPLQILFLVSTVCSLGGTKNVNVPMFVMLRRFTILFTMIAEYFVGGITPTRQIAASVMVLCSGAIIAVTDFSVHFDSVVMILVANVCQALSTVISKQKMEIKDGLGTYGLLMYNSLYSLMCFLPFFTYGKLHVELNESLTDKNWGSPMFVALFLFSCAMASMLNFSILLCTKVNSALTTMVIGVIKNLVTTYLGMFVGNDYTFTWLNFTGLNVSVCGSLIYTWIKYSEGQTQKAQQSNETPIDIEKPLLPTTSSSVPELQAENFAPPPLAGRVGGC